MTASDEHDWLVIHRIKFPEQVDGTDNPMPGPESATIWRFGPHAEMGPDGHYTNVSASWGGFSVHPTKSDATAVLRNPSAHLPFLSEVSEAWHGLAVPYSHRGSVHWSESVQNDSVIRVASSDPGGPIAVITSAGYTNPGPGDEERIKTFSAGVLGVLEFYETLPENLSSGVFVGEAVDGREGCTISIWRDDKAMMDAAYRKGEHKRQLARHLGSALFDRSSFTRARIVASKGRLDGSSALLDAT